MRLISDVGKYIDRAGTRLNSKLKRCTIFEALSIHLNENKPAIFYKEKWKSSCIEFSNVKHFNEMFGVSLQLWRLNFKDHRNSSCLLFGSGQDKNMLHLHIERKLDDERIFHDETVLWIKDISVISYHPCPKENCEFVTNRIDELDQHILAHNADRTKCRQTTFSFSNIMEDMKAEGIIENTFRQTNAVFWDVESLLLPSARGNMHVPVTIAISKNFGVRRDIFLHRSSMEPEALRKLVTDFVDILEEIYIEHKKNFPQYLEKALQDLLIQRKNHNDGLISLSPKALGTICKRIFFLRDSMKLKVYAFNSERYDIPVLKGSLFDILYARDKKFNVIKRGCGIMQINYKNFIFRDIG